MANKVGLRMNVLFRQCDQIWQNLKSLLTIFEGLFNIWQFSNFLCHFSVVGQIFIVVNSQKMAKF